MEILIEKPISDCSINFLNKSEIFICCVSDNIISNLLRCGRAFIPAKLLGFQYNEYSDYILVTNSHTYCFCQFDISCEENETDLRLLSYWKE